MGQRTSAALTGNQTGTNTSTYGSFARLSSFATSGTQTGPLGTPVNQTFDNTGQVATRAPADATDTMTWDALGRLIAVSRRDGSNNGFNWTAAYDGLGRRLQTSQQTVSGGTASGTPLVLQSSYDPEVEFMELAVTTNGSRDWLVRGPDISGSYGAMQGTGGIEAVFNATASTTTGIVSDIYGHTEATVVGSTVTWNTVHSTGYGPAPGNNAVPIDGSHDISEALAWRGHYIDATGYYYMGARYYAPDSGTFLSCDPLGHTASMDLYSYAEGDPVNGFDPDGRCVEGFVGGLIEGSYFQPANATQAAAAMVGQMVGYEIPGYGEFAIARDVSYAVIQTGEATYDISENGLNAQNGMQLGFGILGALPGVGAFGHDLEAADSAFSDMSSLSEDTQSLSEDTNLASNETPPEPVDEDEGNTTVPGSLTGCFIAGTLVQMADGTTEEIQKIKPGDQVKSYDVSQAKWEAMPVERVFSHQFNGDVITLTAGGTKLEVSGNHPLWVVRGDALASRPNAKDVSPKERKFTSAGRWIEARNLRLGDMLLTDAGKQLAIQHLSRRQDNLPVYNIRVEKDHTYAVSQVGILVHNKAAQISPIPGPGSGASALPADAQKALSEITGGAARPNVRQPSSFANDGRSGSQVLPQTDSAGNAITYTEHTVNPRPPGGTLDAKRFVTGSDGSVYYTDDHYATFTKVQ